ncbi:MAG TPA: Zn-ribbon domain-containing OB-fold protein [Thermoplasmata archaeon]|nr:Zn-ribbon domain-containing OB-fold protein [Thermoplasmata archaeon]
MSAPPAAKKKRTASAVVAEPVARSAEPVPYLLDFYPLEGAAQTQLAEFFDALRAGRFRTTRCPRDHQLHWPPRVVCPKCHQGELEWVDLPLTGHVYAFSAVLAGAPLGMEADVPFVVGLVDLDGAPLRLFGRIVGRPWTECRVGMPVRVEPFDVSGGRVFYRFRTAGDGGPPPS